MTSLDLDYSKAISSTIKFEKVVTDLQTQLMALKVTAGQTAKNINTSFATELSRLKVSGFGQTAKDMSQGKVILDQYGEVLNKVKTGIRDIPAAVKPATDSIKPHIETIQTLTGKYSILNNEFARRSQWFITGSIFFGMVNAATQAVKAISDVEMGITQIARVTDDATFNFNNMRDSVIQLGIDYGTAFENVQDISLRWTQAGYNVADTLVLTKDALLAMNTAELNAEQATQGFIAIMSQWNLEAKDLLPTLDKINKVGDDFAVTSQDLVSGLTRASGAAKVMGLSLDQTITLLTTMREASGRTGKEVGKLVAPDKSNFVRKHVLNSGKLQRWTIVSQAA